jgi:hypothetical protein
MTNSFKLYFFSLYFFIMQSKKKDHLDKILSSKISESNKEFFFEIYRSQSLYLIKQVK